MAQAKLISLWAHYQLDDFSKSLPAKLKVLNSGWILSLSLTYWIGFTGKPVELVPAKPSRGASGMKNKLWTLDPTEYFQSLCCCCCRQIDRDETPLAIISIRHGFSPQEQSSAVQEFPPQPMYSFSVTKQGCEEGFHSAMHTGLRGTL